MPLLAGPLPHIPLTCLCAVHCYFEGAPPPQWAYVPEPPRDLSAPPWAARHWIEDQKRCACIFPYSQELGLRPEGSLSDLWEKICHPDRLADELVRPEVVIGLPFLSHQPPGVPWR